MPPPMVTGLSPRACALCRRKDDLLRCSKCQHLRDIQGDLFVPDDIFNNGVGHFWRIIETRPYMLACYGVVDALLLNFGSVGAPVDAIETALDHLTDMMRLCRSDNMGLRGVVPFLLVRLGRDQEACDFMKWYATTGNDAQYGWGNTELPYLDVKDADILEPLGNMWITTQWLDLTHSIAVLLSKIRVLLDLQAIHAVTITLGGKLPTEILLLILADFVGPVIESRPDLLRSSIEEVSHLMVTLKSQVATLFKSADRYNRHFFRSMLNNPASAIADRSEYCSPGSHEESNTVMGFSYYAWAETPGAIQLVKHLRN
ncbi:hypothetical protein QQS21_012308 [Conoideocrella luteorostrata]|uniref:Uncharacterized protein n=1 Tax=Conoideocrella luteorostrata TaxID=1105319 RepID=A0AAJ0FUZ6_9HYPO|nr:hypothetical protein QQS21_012308 [Conoideocrella luteorostrata]